uniref:BTB domain-containing protein n=1 Tax=Caenorhabditis japonica TaxID=281687 RepID=A0A8R1J106_CAEJA
MPFKKVSKVFLIRTNSLTEEHRTYRADNVTWTLDASLSPPSQFLALKLTCNRKNPSPIWKCSASICISLFKCTPGHMKEEKVMQIDEHDFKATANCVRWDKLKRISELMLPENQYLEKGQISLLLEITVSKMSGIQQKETRFNFRKPCEDIFDAMLMVEGKPVHVGRQFLSTHSQFFADLFRQNRETVHQIDAVYNEFIDFLDLIYPTDKNIKREKVAHLLKLAHRFGVTRIMSRCENFAIQDGYMEVTDKFLLAEKYQLSKLQCQVLRGLKTSEEVRLISKHPLFNELGDATKTAIFARMIAIMDNQCAEKSEPG